MPRHTDTRSRILELAHSLLQAHGFHGFSYRHLADALGIKTAAVHYHFRNKADLGVELVIELRRKFQCWATDIDNRTLKAMERLDGFCEMHRMILDHGGSSPFGLLDVLVDQLPERMSREVLVLAGEIHGWLARTLRQGLASGELSFHGEPDDQALIVGAAILGALLMARALGADKYRSAIAQLKKQLTPGK
ncbi:MAG: TetR/AcrR family transcriptional regulator [Cyanobacteria bacterium NC_groundwater_1444_Ag_S-0.65um_54_12]|nr:TetR/AcrR family transcriptional regulator [Cyanobacteria bacterium NC_groundwater_1444_Ag_S-0.65um_54_12]